MWKLSKLDDRDGPDTARMDTGETANRWCAGREEEAKANQNSGGLRLQKESNCTEKSIKGVKRR
jgi:hypothetical protein